MAEKQVLKASEARILIYLANAKVQKRYVKAISNKLDIDYTYLLNILGKMLTKGWITREQEALKTYYHITKQGSFFLKKAKELLRK